MKIAVVTGEHGFQEKQFDAVFESMEGVQFCPRGSGCFCRRSKPKGLRYRRLLQLSPSLSDGRASSRRFSV